MRIATKDLKLNMKLAYYVLFCLIIFVLQLLQSFFNGEGMSVAVGSAPNNKPKNRFANIVACMFKLINSHCVTNNVMFMHAITEVR